MAGEPALHLGFKPLPALLVLTCRAMAVAARAVNDVEVSTFFTLIIGDSCLLGAACNHRIGGFSVPKHSMYCGPKVEKISFIVVMIETLHHLIDQMGGIFLSLLGEV